jgi:hypothetical protein
MADDNQGSRTFLAIVLGGIVLALVVAAFFMYGHKGDTDVKVEQPMTEQPAESPAPPPEETPAAPEEPPAAEAPADETPAMEPEAPAMEPEAPADEPPAEEAPDEEPAEEAPQ